LLPEQIDGKYGFIVTYRVLPLSWKSLIRSARIPFTEC